MSDRVGAVRAPELIYGARRLAVELEGFSLKVDEWIRKSRLEPSAKVCVVLAIGIDDERVIALYRALVEAAAADHPASADDGIRVQAIPGGAGKGECGGKGGPAPALGAAREHKERRAPVFNRIAVENIKRWVAERCRLDGGAFAFTKDLHRDFNAWAQGAGTWSEVEKMISVVLWASHKPLLKRTRRWRAGRQMRGFCGIGLLAADGPRLPSGQGSIPVTHKTQVTKVANLPV